MRTTQYFACVTACIFSASALADISIESSCNIGVRGNVQFENTELSIMPDTGSIIVFTNQNDVYVDGKKLDLTAQQQEDANAYYAAVTQAIPLTINIAKEGMMLASETVGEVFGELLGQDNVMMDEVNVLFADLERNLDQRFHNEQGGFILRGNDLQQNGWMSNTWENEFDQRVDNLIAKLAGRLLLSLGSELMFGNEDPSTVLGRLENIDSTIEKRVEGRAQIIEARADELCLVLEKADAAENGLSYSHDKLAQLNILNIRQGHAK